VSENRHRQGALEENLFSGYKQGRRKKDKENVLSTFRDKKDLFLQGFAGSKKKSKEEVKKSISNEWELYLEGERGGRGQRPNRRTGAYFNLCLLKK